MQAASHTGRLRAQLELAGALFKQLELRLGPNVCGHRKAEEASGKKRHG
jgi:hypothetical protein